MSNGLFEVLIIISLLKRKMWTSPNQRMLFVSKFESLMVSLFKCTPEVFTLRQQAVELNVRKTANSMWDC